MSETITATVFSVESEAFQAMTELKRLDDKRCVIEQTAIIKRTSGKTEILDSWDNSSVRNSATLKDTLIGAVVGFIMGPIGILVGGGIGALIGMTGNDDDYIESASLIENISTKIYEGETVLIALLKETDETVFDGEMESFDTQILRWDAEEVRSQVSEAKELQKDLARQARSTLRGKND